MQQRNLEQRCAIKFGVKRGESASVTFDKLKQAYGEHSLSRAQVFRWHKSFLNGREHVEDEPRSGRPSTSKTEENVERVRDLARSDRHLTIRMMSDQLNLNSFTVHQILREDLHMRKLPNDLENWMEYSMMKCQMRFKEHAVPHIFASEPYWKRAADSADFVVKRVRTVVPVVTDPEIKAKSSSILKSNKTILVDKCVQVTPDYQNKSVQCQYKEIKMEEASTSHCGIEFIDVNRIDNNDKLLDNSTQTGDDDDDKSNVLIDSVNIKTECDQDNFEDYATEDCTQEIFIKTEIDIKEEELDQ